MPTNSPDIDPANNNSLAGSLRFAFKKMMMDTNGMLPAQVIRYDRTANRAQVQILISIVGTDGSLQSRPQIASIPVLILGGGDLMLSFPLKVGDLGWVVANDRDISLFLQTYTQTPPNTGRIKNFSDAMFIPDVMRGYVINGEDDENAVLSTTDGSIRIAIGATGVKITAPNLTVDGDLIVSGSAAFSGLTVTGDIDATGAPGGTLHIMGNLTASGSITPNIPP